MKKTVVIVLITIIVLSAAGLTYLNKVILPQKVKGLIIKAIENQTQKKVTLGSLSVNIFRGLVVRDLNIYDNEAEIVRVKEASCVFWIWGLTQKKIIISNINLDSAYIFLEKRKDGTFNLADFFSTRQKSGQDKPALIKGQELSGRPKPLSGFNIEIYRISIVNSSINFKDNSISTPFNQNLNDVDINIHLSLPAALKFKASAQIPGKFKSNILLRGEFKIPQEELTANIAINSLPVDKFAPYYQSSGIGIGSGLIDAMIYLVFKNDALSLDCQFKSSGLSLKKDKAIFNLNSQISANIKYIFKGGSLNYSGKAIFTDSSISGLDFIDSISGLNATLNFDNNGFSSSNIRANIWNLPAYGKVKLNNFDNPALNVDIFSLLDLAKAQDILKSKFNFILPAELNGSAFLLLHIATNKLNKGIFDLSGYLDVTNALVKLDKINDPLQEVRGRLDFTSNQVQTQGMSLKYQGLPYKLSMIVDDFNSPSVALDISSTDLKLQSNFKVDNNKIDIGSLSGSYLNSDFNLSGNFDVSNSNACFTGILNMKLEDLKKPLAKFKEIERISPVGDMQVKFAFSGEISDIKGSSIQAQIASTNISLYGLKGSGLSCSYNQQAGIMDIPSLKFSFYGGIINASAKANFKSDNLPYSLVLSMQDVKLEELKLDTGAKDKDIAGVIAGEIKADGVYNDLSRLTGSGNLAITKGKLWELNIFKGLGKLIFAKDFSRIVFHEGSCSFTIADSYLFTKDLMLKSNMAYLSGLVKLGFNSSIDATLNIDIIDNLIPLSGTLKEVTTAVIGRADRFAAINITGTLSDPKYKLRPAMENIIKGLADKINKNIFKK